MSGSGESGRYHYWTALLQDAVESDDHTVELVPAERHGWQVQIDGVEMFKYKDGLPWENFTLANRDEFWEYLSDEGEEKARELQDSVESDDAPSIGGGVR